MALGRVILAVSLSLLMMPSAAQSQYDRQWKIYVVPFSHTDVGYTDAVPSVIGAHNRYLDTVVTYVKRTAGNAPGEMFKWTIEIPWVLESYTSTRSAAQVEELMSLVRSGSVEIGAMHFSLQTDLCGNEELVRSLYYAQELRSKYNVSIRTALQNDTPGFTWSLAQLLAKAEIPYLSVAMNSALADSLYPKINLPYLFRLQAQDGSQTLMWRCMDSLWAYLEGGITYGVYGPYATMDQRISALLTKLVARGYPYDAVLINCATGDNGPPNMQIVENVRQWNQSHPGATMIVSTFSEFFDYVSGTYAGTIPSYSGDAPNWWTWLFAPSATGGYARSRTAQTLLPAAEALATIAAAVDPGAQYPEKPLRDAYVNNLYFEDHNLGAINPSGNAPYWQYKMGWVSAAAETAQAVISRSADAIAQTIPTGADPALIAFNPLGWERSEIVRIPLTDPVVAGLGPFNVLDAGTMAPNPLQRLSDGTVAFLARNIPAAGYRVFLLAPRPEPLPLQHPLSGLVLENEFYKVDMTPLSGAARSVVDKTVNRELTALDGKFKQYTKNSTQPPAGLTVASSDSGTVLQQITLKGIAPGTSSYQTTAILPAGVKRIDFRDAYDKLAPGSLESTDYFFHTGAGSPQLRYEIPFGHVRLFDDELSGFRPKHYAVQGWMNVSSAGDQFNMTLATDNAVVTAVSSGVFTGTLRQLVAFNDANTAYRAGTGPLSMNFWVTSDTAALHPERALTFAHGLNGPLPVRILPAGRPGPMPDTCWSLVHGSAPEVIITTIKNPMNGLGSIVRLYNPTSSTVSADLLFAATVTLASETSLLEQDKQALIPSGTALPVTLGPFEVKTVRVSVSPVVAANYPGDLPVAFALFQNYPNPFNPSTVIRYDLGGSARVTLRLFNVLGQMVRTLVDGANAAGSYQVTWDGRNDQGKSLASGVYFANLEAVAGNGTVFRSAKSMILIR